MRASIVRAQPPTVPIVGVLSSLAVQDRDRVMPAFRQGLGEMKYVEGVNVSIEYRWAEGRYERLSSMAAELVRRPVVVIAALSGTPAAQAAKRATTTIPVVFAVGGDPIALDLVGSLSRPTANVTGVTFFTAQLGGKRLELMRELAPRSSVIAVLVNPKNPASALEGQGVESAAQAIGQSVRLVEATSESDIDRAFTLVAQQRIRALVVSADPIFVSQRKRLVALAARHAVLAIYADREITEAGGLISYGASRSDAYRQAGVYVGRILKGERPSNLPVVEPTRFELVINLATSRALGLTIPPSLLLQADQIIE